MGIKTFWCEQIALGLCSVNLRSDKSIACPLGQTGLQYHTGYVCLPEEMTQEQWQELEWDDKFKRALDLRPRCACGFEFTKESAQMWGSGFNPKYRRVDTGAVLSLEDMPPGACFDADCYHDIPHWCGADGISLHVKLPCGTVWHVDGEASNCTRRGDHSHKCWCRHGDPKLCNVTVDKNGNTCHAGAGSIQTKHWHGFLRNGELVI